jgi:hypothetical protein
MYGPARLPDTVVEETVELKEYFKGTVDLSLWVPHDLAHWSSRSASAATWKIEPDGLHVSIPPDQALCVAGVIGSEIYGPQTAVGMGMHRFRDPALTEAFTKVPLELDTTEDHDHAVDRTARDVVFEVDSREVRRVGQSPDYPMQLMIGVFDFRARRDPGETGLVPELVVRRVHGRPLADGIGR